MSSVYLKIRVLIADDHEMIRHGLQVMARKIDEFEIIGEAQDGEELLELSRILNPDVILTDVKMPKLSGIEATQIIKREQPHIGIIALSSFDEENLILEILNAGANGYLLKNASKKELTEAIKAAYKDERYYCKEINLKLAQIISVGRQNRTLKEKEQNFTSRELQVIQEICLGYPSKQIASHLGIKTRTVERYRDSIMQKMEVNNATAVVMYAIAKGICKLPVEKK